MEGENGNFLLEQRGAVLFILITIVRQHYLVRYKSVVIERGVIGAEYFVVFGVIHNNTILGNFIAKGEFGSNANLVFVIKRTICILTQSNRRKFGNGCAIGNFDVIRNIGSIHTGMAGGTNNTFIGEERNIVTDIAGTTRDSIYTRYNKFGFDFYLVDTAGIRKKNKVNEDIEYYSVIRSIRAIEASDVCILMIDATRGIESQDVSIFSLIQRNKKGLVVCVNKWDLVKDKSEAAIKHFENTIRERFAPFTDFPIIFGSALTKQRIYKVLETAVDVHNNRCRTVSTSQLNTVMREVIEAYPPPANKGKYIKIKYITMLKGAPIPTFIFFCNLPQWVKEPYRRYLENKIRENWNFRGTPINVFMREK